MEQRRRPKVFSWTNLAAIAICVVLCLPAPLEARTFQHKLIADDASPLGGRTPLILIHGKGGTDPDLFSNPPRADWYNFLSSFYKNGGMTAQYKVYRFHYLSNEVTVRNINSWLQQLNTGTANIDAKTIAYYGFINATTSILYHYASTFSPAGFLDWLIEVHDPKSNPHGSIELAAVLINKFDPTFNDGLVPIDSGQFLGHTLLKRAVCPGYDHLDMVAGSFGQCSTGLTLFNSLAEDLGLPSPVDTAPPTSTLTSPSNGQHELRCEPRGGTRQLRDGELDGRQSGQPDDLRLRIFPGGHEQPGGWNFQCPDRRIDLHRRV